MNLTRLAQLRKIVITAGIMIASVVIPTTASAATVQKVFDTSVWSTRATLSNCASMPGSHTVKGCALAYHTNDRINFYWTRIDMQVMDYDSGKIVALGSCKNAGDWAVKFGRGCNIQTDNAYGGGYWRVNSRICADIQSDGPGERCSPWAIQVTAY